METTVTKELAEGVRVYLVYDPGQESGVIVAAAGPKSQWLVTWNSGKTWIYHSSDLALVES